MKIVSIPALAVLSASAYHVIKLYIPASCEAFVPSTTKVRVGITTTVPEINKGGIFLSRIHNRRSSACFSENTDGVGGSPFESIDEIESRISAMKVVELRAELKSHGQTTSGLKKILQERLLDFYQAKMTNLEEEYITADVDNEINEDGGGEIEEETERKFVTHDIEDKMREESTRSADSDISSVHNQDDESLPSGLFASKAKWKKKCQLMINDARKLIDSKKATDRQRGPKKARENVRRIQRWISLSPDDFDASYDEEVEEEEFREFQRNWLLKAYNVWMDAIAKSGDDNAGYQAQQVLDEMQENISIGGPPPNDVTISSAMNAIAQSARGGAAAEAFLFGLLERYEANSGVNDMPWSIKSDNALQNNLVVRCDVMLNALASGGTMESADRVKTIVLRLEEYQRQREKQRMENRSKKSRRKSSLEKEATIIKRPITYATVMKAYAGVGTVEAAFRAESTLKDLVQRAKLEKRKKRDESDEADELSRLVLVEPTTVVFNSVIQCWANSGNVRAGKRAERLLEEMKELAGISSSGNSEGNKEKTYFDTRPDIITYNTVLHAWTRCGKKNSAPRAEKIVKDLMKEHHADPTSVVANTITFNTVLNAWSKSEKSNAPYRAEQLLEYMIQLNNAETQPDTYSFSTVMNAWAKSKEPNKAFRAQNLLSRLIEMHQEALENGDKRRADALKPRQYPYNTVLNACAFSWYTSEEERKEAIQIAVNTFKAMSPLDSPSMRNGNQNLVSRDSVTYGNMLKCFANLMPVGGNRWRMAITVFQECCENGLVGEMVWKEVRRAAPSKHIEASFPRIKDSKSLEVKDLPREWTLNQKDRRVIRPKRKKKDKKPERKSQPFIIERSYATGEHL